MESIVPSRNVHTGRRQRHGLGPIVSYSLLCQSRSLYRLRSPFLYSVIKPLHYLSDTAVPAKGLTHLFGLFSFPEVIPEIPRFITLMGNVTDVTESKCSLGSTLAASL